MPAHVRVLVVSAAAELPLLPTPSGILAFKLPPPVAAEQAFQAYERLSRPPAEQQDPPVAHRHFPDRCRAELDLVHGRVQPWAVMSFVTPLFV